MQTLNVGAGRTDEEYQAAEEQRRADLRADSRSDANYFFLAAGLAGLGAGLLPIRLGIFVNIGAIDLLTRYAAYSGRLHPLVLYGAAAVWVVALVGLGLAAQRGHRWAFLLGLVLYGADMVPLAMEFSFWSFGIHGFLLLKWFQGQKTLQELKEATASR
jgi:hypothetical protein